MPSIRAREPDLRVRGNLGGESSSMVWFSSGSLWEDLDDPCLDPFLAARPRTSSAMSAADFFLDLSSSEERLEDMMVSRVPMARLFLLTPIGLRPRRLMFLSSSDEMAWSVGPWESWAWSPEAMKDVPDPWGA